MAITDRSALSGLIPEETASEIIGAMPATSAALAAFRNIAVRSKQTRVPIIDVLPEASWVEELTEDGVDGSDHVKPVSTMGVSSVYVNVEPLATIVVIPDEVVEDIAAGAGVDAWAQAQDLVGSAFAQKIDKAVFFGLHGVTSPASFPDGIAVQALAAGNDVSVASVADLSVAINDAMGAVELDGFDVNALFASRAIRAQLRGLRDDNGQPIYLTGLRSDGDTEAVYGRRLTTVDNGAWTAYTAGPPENGATMIVGDGSNVRVAIRTDMNYKILTEATVTDGANTINLAQSDATGLRIVMRVGFQVYVPPSFEVSGAGRFPFAVVRP